MRAIAAVAKTIDPTTSREETFGDTQRLRPGHVITNAVVDGRKMAIDVESPPKPNVLKET